ncbi:MAG: Maf family protein [Oscillospiraceae bacterium]|nr:Maf family protein [Oscillospiraceae bacterium]
MHKIILASQSPRRRELLSKLGFTFDVIAPDVCEDIIDGLSPAEFAATLSRRKLNAILDMADTQADSAVIIAADTVVSIDNRILGKPTDENDAHLMLQALSGRQHSVFTGLSVSLDGKIVTDVCETLVQFRDLTDDEIRDYIKTGEPFDKAGGYGIQGAAKEFVASYDGSYNNVVGLPTEMLMNILGGIQ